LVQDNFQFLTSVLAVLTLGCLEMWPGWRYKQCTKNFGIETSWKSKNGTGNCKSGLQGLEKDENGSRSCSVTVNGITAESSG
jgi:hypothetical protein